MGRDRGPKLGPTAPGTQREQVDVPYALHGVRLDQAVSRLVERLSRTKARKVIGMGGVYIGQKRCRVASRPVHAGDHLTVTWHDAVLTPRSFELEVLFEDEDVAVINKPAGQHVQGTELGDVGTLAWAAVKRFGPEARLAHRLDAPASGVMILGKRTHVVNQLMERFRTHDIEREYLAITRGVPASGRCTTPLRRSGRTMTVADAGEQGALSAQTDFEILEQEGSLALVRARLHTGRTHQVRVHLASLGAPIVGDRIYGEGEGERLCLHALRLRVTLSKGQTIHEQREPGSDFWNVAGLAPRDVSNASQT